MYHLIALTFVNIWVECMIIYIPMYEKFLTKHDKKIKIKKFEKKI